MARFYGDLQGSRGEATRCGTAGSGIRSHVRGWHVGARVSMRSDDGQDVAYLAATYGSAGGSGGEAIGAVRLDESGSLVLEPSAWTIAQCEAAKRRQRTAARKAAKLAAREARRERYRKLRASHPYYGARTAWHYASQPDAPALDWQHDGRGGMRAETREAGYTVRLRMDMDYGADWTEGTFTDSWSVDAVAMPEPRERGTYRYYVPSVTYREHVRGLRELGYARHAADCLARQYVREALAADIRGRECVYVVATAYLAGVELGSAAIGGHELAESWSRDSVSVERQLNALVDECQLIAEAVEHAKSTRSALGTVEAR